VASQPATLAFNLEDAGCLWHCALTCMHTCLMPIRRCLQQQQQQQQQEEQQQWH